MPINEVNPGDLEQTTHLKVLGWGSGEVQHPFPVTEIYMEMYTNVGS